MHCIVSGGRLMPDRKIRKAGGRFFIPVRVLRDKFKGKYLAGLDSLYKGGKLAFSSTCEGLRTPADGQGSVTAFTRRNGVPT